MMHQPPSKSPNQIWLNAITQPNDTSLVNGAVRLSDSVPPLYVTARSSERDSTVQRERIRLSSVVKKHISLVLKDEISDQECCIIKTGQCHVCFSSNCHEPTAVVSCCSNMIPMHSVCFEHFRSLYNVSVHDACRKNTTFVKFFKCAICALICDCGICSHKKTEIYENYCVRLAKCKARVYKGDECGRLSSINGTEELVQDQEKHTKNGGSGLLDAYDVTRVHAFESPGAVRKWAVPADTKAEEFARSTNISSVTRKLDSPLHKTLVHFDKKQANMSDVHLSGCEIDNVTADVKTNILQQSQGIYIGTSKREKEYDGLDKPTQSIGSQIHYPSDCNRFSRATQSRSHRDSINKKVQVEQRKESEFSTTSVTHSEPAARKAHRRISSRSGGSHLSSDHAARISDVCGRDKNTLPHVCKRRKRTRRCPTPFSSDEGAAFSNTRIHDLVDSGESLEGADEAILEEVDANLDYCAMCYRAGNLICCDVCPRSYHFKCLDFTKKDLPKGQWHCPECKNGSVLEGFVAALRTKTSLIDKCRLILSTLESSSLAHQFLQPVQHAPDYSRIIKKPMDFSTIKRKLRRMQYFTSDQNFDMNGFVDDVRLVWSNCREYNDDNSGIVRAAQMLEEDFERMLARVAF